MILQALNRYYERAENMPREGWVRRGVDYVIVLNNQGHCVNIELIGEQKKGKTVPREMLVPSIGKQAMKHTNSGNDANLLWDNASFVFGTGNKGVEKIGSFISTLRDWLGKIADEGVEAVVAFCIQLQSAPESVDALIARFLLQEDFDKRDPVLVFRLVSDVECVHARLTVRLAYEDALATRQSDSILRGNCLVTGESGVPLAPNESVIKGVWGGQPAGCNIVSFNAHAFESYGKRDRNGENAPVSLRASFAYTTALNHLLGSTQRIQVGDASTVFWADRNSEFESAAANIFGEPPKDDPDRGARAVQALFSAMQSGKLGGLDDNNRFHVLGLAPNAARISVRFYHCLPLRDLAARILQHFKDLELARGPNDAQYPSLFRLLAAVAVQNKADNIPPNLGGAIVDAVFAGSDVPHPSLWLNAAVGRCRAEQTVNYLRAAAIKACLNRQIRRASNPDSDRLTEKEFLPMLDLSNTNPAYRLGRLFAALEKIQEEASPGLNATIRDRYYGAASSTPVAVFTTLLRLKNSHLKKLSVGRAMWFEKLLGEILSSVTDFQKHLPLPDQGRFALGYYHQRQDFFTKKSDNSTLTTGGNQS